MVRFNQMVLLGLKVPIRVKPRNGNFQYFPDLQREILYVWVGSNSEVQVFLILAVGVVPFPTHSGRLAFGDI